MSAELKGTSLSGSVQEDPPKVSRKRKNQPNNGKPFIAIHLGAGEYTLTDRKKELYRDLCTKACRTGMDILLKGGTADEAVTKATQILEDSTLVNAGRSSSLTFDGRVETDAGFMSGDGYFGGVGAVPGVSNPILIARKIADKHRETPVLSCGRVPPIYLCGEGAKGWAKENGISVPENSNFACDKTKTKYKKYMAKVNKISENGVHSLPLDISKKVGDTVGAVALDCSGNVAAAVSSGGNWLKNSGRVGHTPLFGCGCWASSNHEHNSSVVISSSGSGEMLAKVRVPQAVSKKVLSEQCYLSEALDQVIKTEYLENEILNCHKEIRNIGIIAIQCDETGAEFAFSHSSRDFIVATLKSSKKLVQVTFSELPKSSVPGKSLITEVIPIR